MNENSFAEKKKIYRLLAIAMAEDNNVSPEEKMAIVTILMYRYCDSKSKNEKSLSIWKKKGFKFFLRHIINRDGEKEEINDMFCKFNDVEEQIKRHGIAYCDSDLKVKETLKCQYKSAGILLSNELKNDLLGSIILKQIEVDKRNEKFRVLLSSLTETSSSLFEFKESLCKKIREDSQISESCNEYSILEEVCKSEEDYYTARIKPLVLHYLKLCVLCMLLVEKSLEELKADINSSVGKSIFMNVNALTEQEKTRELKEMVYVIRSDGSIMDRERESFRVVCKIFRVKGSSELWRRLYSCEVAELLNNNYKYKSTKISYKSTALNVNDFKNIEQSISSFDIKGKIINGAYHVLQRSEMREKDDIYSSDKKWSNLAIWTFSISALILYFFVADLVNQTEDRKIIFDIIHIKQYLEKPKVWTEWFGASMLIIFIGYLLTKWWKDCKNDFSKYLTRLLSSVIILLLFLSIKCCFETDWSDLVGTFFIPLTLVAMMLSIEWLIFMRQEYSELTHNVKAQKEVKKSNASVLVILVCAAILIDVCLGIVELIAHSKIPNVQGVLPSPPSIEDYVSKIASALILGCICFFAGKFLDMSRMQQQTDICMMRECTETLKKKVNEENNKIN